MKPLAKTDSNSPGGATPAATIEEQVASLLAAGKAKQAVELAKDLHKRLNTPQSQQLLVDAYVARIQQFQQKGAAQDARVLIELVATRFPTHRGQLDGVLLKSAAAEGRLDQLVAPLARTDLSAELRQTIETALRRDVIDLPRLAQAGTLSPEHPLRLEAAALWKGFTAVTTGAVQDDQLALPEVSRRSPLASWKMLIRAIAAFYRRDDESCRRSLQQIAPDSAVNKLATILLATLDNQAKPPGRAGLLQEKIGVSDQKLREALRALDRAINDHAERQLVHSSGKALALCRSQHPELVDRLRQHLFLKVLVSDIRSEVGLSAAGRPLADAYFWRLCAQSADSCGAHQFGAAQWERFRVHAISEGLIAPGSLEEAAVLLATAKSVTQFDAQEVALHRLGFDPVDFIRNSYLNQPPHIAALRPTREAVRAVFDIDALFGRAVAIRSDSEIFRLWADWYARQTPRMVRQQEDVARKWRAALPREIEPLLTLMTLAEERDALKIATDHLNLAEAIDPMNPLVRRARLRLMLATTWRHFKNKKPALVEKDLATLAALPAMAEPLRVAFVSAIRVGWHVLRGDKAAAEQLGREIIGQVGAQMGVTLMSAVQIAAGLENDAGWPVAALPLPTPVEVADTEARLVSLTRELNIKFFRPSSWDPMIEQVLRQQPCPLPLASIVAIAGAADSNQTHRLAYLATVAGLPTARGEAAAELLFYRARALPRRAGVRREQCFQAALELARHGHQPELLSLITRHLDAIGNHYYSGPNREISRSLEPDHLERILQLEREANEFPDTVAEANEYLLGSDATDSRGWDPSAEASSGGVDEFGWDDEEDDDEDPQGELFDLEDDSLDPDMFPDLHAAVNQLLPEFTKKVSARLGHEPTAEDIGSLAPELLAEVLRHLSGDKIDRAEAEQIVRDIQNSESDARQHGRRRKKRR
jgi:hypothetical protein